MQLYLRDYYKALRCVKMRQTCMGAKMTTYIDLSDGNINHATHNN